MVTTTCLELAGVNCHIPIVGNSLSELQTHVVAHSQSAHPDLLLRMSKQDHGRFLRRIQTVWENKAVVEASF